MRFYFTVHPGDLMRTRLLDGCYVMQVASAHWDDDKKRFRVRRVPADVVSGICVDSGGFTAAKRWGKYPWTVEQYADFVRELARDVPLEFVATMDYACEPGVNREVIATNRARIDASIENDAMCRTVAPDLPWLSVLQGDSLDEREYDLGRRAAAGLLPGEYAGIGSICGRRNRAAREVVRWYGRQLPGVQYHGFGLAVRVLDDPGAAWHIRSWDSYAWNWARGRAGMDRPEIYERGQGEGWSAYTARLGRLYYENTVMPRIDRVQQVPMVFHEVLR